MKFLGCLLTFVLVFGSCSYEPKKIHRTEKNKALEEYEAVLVLYLHKTIEEYKNTIAFLRENQVIYKDMVKVYHRINTIYNQIVRKQEASFQALEKLQNQVEILEELLAHANWPAEIHKRLQDIKDEIEFVQKALRESSAQPSEEEPATEPSVEKTPASEEEPATELPVEETPASEEESETEPPVEETPTSEEESAKTALLEDPALKEEPATELPVEETPTSEEEPTTEPPVEETSTSEEEPATEPSGEETSTSEKEPATEPPVEETSTSEEESATVIPSVSIIIR